MTFYSIDPDPEADNDNDLVLAIQTALLNILYASLNGVLSDLSPRQAFARALQVLPGAMVAWLG